MSVFGPPFPEKRKRRHNPQLQRYSDFVNNCYDLSPARCLRAAVSDGFAAVPRHVRPPGIAFA